MKAEKDKGKDEGSNVEVNKDKEIKVGGQIRLNLW